MARLFTRTDSDRLNSGATPVTGYPLTLAVWAKPASLTGFPQAFGIGNSVTTNNYYVLGFHTTGNAQLNISGTFINHPDDLTTDQWHLLVGSSSSSIDHKVWSNDNAVFTATPSKTLTGFDDVMVGALRTVPASSHFDGLIAHCVIWNTSFSDSDVLQFWNGGIPISPYDLGLHVNNIQAYYPLFEDDNDINWQGNSTYDLSVDNGTPAYGQHSPLILPFAPRKRVSTAAGGVLVVPAINSQSSVIAPTVVPGNVTLTIPVVNSQSSVIAPTVTPGNVTLTIPVVNSQSSVIAPTVTPGNVTLTIPVVNSESSVIAPTVAPGNVTLTVPVVNSESSVIAPGIATGSVLAVPVINSQSSVIAPTVVSGGVDLLVPVINSQSSVIAPNVGTGNVLIVPVINSEISAIAPGVLTGNVLTAPVINSQSSVIAPTVVAGGVALLVPVINSQSSVIAPNVGTGAILRNLAFTVRIPTTLSFEVN